MTATEIFGLIVLLSLIGVTIKHVIPFLFKATLFIGKYVLIGAVAISILFFMTNIG